MTMDQRFRHHSRLSILPFLFLLPEETSRVERLLRLWLQLHLLPGGGLLPVSKWRLFKIFVKRNSKS